MFLQGIDVDTGDIMIGNIFIHRIGCVLFLNKMKVNDKQKYYE